MGDREYLLVSIDLDTLSTSEVADLIERLRAMRGVKKVHTLNNILDRLFPEEEPAK